MKSRIELLEKCKSSEPEFVPGHEQTLKRLLFQDNHVHEDDDDVEDEDEDTNSTTANEYLRDTISLMTAMEARISSAEENIKQKEVSSSSALASRASASASAR